jgi:hypothetical protein
MRPVAGVEVRMMPTVTLRPSGLPMVAQLRHPAATPDLESRAITA